MGPWAFWYFFGAGILILLALAVVSVTVFLIISRARREGAKREALLWIADGKAPAGAPLDRVRAVLVKYGNKKECGDILTRLDALTGSGYKY